MPVINPLILDDNDPYAYNKISSSLAALENLLSKHHRATIIRGNSLLPPDGYGSVVAVQTGFDILKKGNAMIEFEWGNKFLHNIASALSR